MNRKEFFKELVLALEALPEKELGRGVYRDAAGVYCSIGALMHYRGVQITPKNAKDAATPLLLQEVFLFNDRHYSDKDPRGERWKAVHKWAKEQLGETTGSKQRQSNNRKGTSE